jgi:ubiquitin-conjugating enzyme E2 M
VLLLAAAAAAVQDPNPEDPLNKEAAQKYQESQRNFETIVQRSIHYGAQIANDYFPPCAT